MIRAFFWTTVFILGYWVLPILFVILIIRTLCWHLQNWQIREYRFDRMFSYLKTKEGIHNIFNLWFFRGICPRPKFTGRIFLIFILLVGLLLLALFYTKELLPLSLTIFLIERSLFLFVTMAVFLSKIPTFISREILFFRAQKITKKAQNIITIGIAGSFGKSSTKEILVHLLKSHKGEKNILFNPENQNTEIAIARLILKHKDFFIKKAQKTKYFIVEVGAYRRGEIAKVCKFIHPHCSILTGLNAQHIELFGSQKNIQRAKFEMAEATTQKVFFNADSPLLAEIFNDRAINATKIAISTEQVKIKSHIDRTNFKCYGQTFTLPWPGKFFVSNALLCIECVREIGIPLENIVNHLKTLKPLKRSLNIEQHSSGATCLIDTYSANPDGVLAAIEHLEKATGKKIFIGLPLRELGPTAETVHKKIFQKLKTIKAEVFWHKSDFAKLGHEICGKKFHDISSLERSLKSLKKEDMVLLEGKLPKDILKMVREN